MALYCYVKTQSQIVIRPLGGRVVATGQIRIDKIARYLSRACLILGIIFLVNATGPILVYELESQGFRYELVSPVKILGDTSMVVDYSQPSSWFPTAPDSILRPSRITHYTISIPRLKIENAVVEIGGKDLTTSLVQYPGTTLPGQYGNTVVFGHSVLPQFYNPKNYKTIFSTLPTLKYGDMLTVNFDGVEYRYQVIKMVEVAPDDVSVLEQQYDREYLSLITCVPPGTYAKRLIVKTVLTKI